MQLTVKDTAKALNVAEKTVYRWIQSGGLPAYRVAGLVGSWDLPDLSEHTGPLLLLTDRTDTGWTYTVAAHELRTVGVDAVLPFALTIPK